MKGIPIALLCLLTLVPSATTASETIRVSHDSRILKLYRFMAAHKFAKPYHAQTYIKAADGSNVDYRLLAAITFVESGGCKRYLFNNCFGYGSSSSLVHFASIPEGIRYVSGKLGSSATYRGKTDFQIAQTYGPHRYIDGKWLPSATYAPTVERLMREVANEPTN